METAFLNNTFEMEKQSAKSKNNDCNVSKAKIQARKITSDYRSNYPLNARSAAVYLSPDASFTSSVKKIRSNLLVGNKSHTEVDSPHYYRF